MFCFILSFPFLLIGPLCFIIFCFIFFICDWLLLSYIVCEAPEKHHATFPPFQSRVRGRLSPCPPFPASRPRSVHQRYQLRRVPHCVLHCVAFSIVLRSPLRSPLRCVLHCVLHCVLIDRIAIAFSLHCTYLCFHYLSTDRRI